MIVFLVIGTSRVGWRVTEAISLGLLRTIYRVAKQAFTHSPRGTTAPSTLVARIDF
jgi:hypothetical protein